MPGISRKNFIAVIAIGLLQLRAPFSSAATGPTLKPTRIGQSIIWRGKKYTAIRSGKKLVWNKGVAIPVKKASVSPSPKPTTDALPSSSPSPTSSPTQTTEVKPVGLFEVDIAGSSEVPNGETRLFYPGDVRVKGKGFLITREKNVLIAFDNNCTHEICPVEIDKSELVCRCHDSFFNRVTGSATSGPASEPLRGYPVRETAGRILVTDSY